MAYIDMIELGTPKHILPQLVVDAWDPDSSPDLLTVTLCCVPNNTKAVTVRGSIKSGQSDRLMQIREYGTEIVCVAQRTKVANIRSNFSGRVKIDSALRFDVYADNAGIAEVIIWVDEVWI